MTSGCGSASTLIAIAKATGAKTVGFELSPWAYFLAKLNIKLHNATTKVLYRNFYKQDLSGATIIFCFLLDSVMKKLGYKLDTDLKPGTTVISYAFKIPQWEPSKVINTNPNNPKASKIYIYKR